MALDQKFIKKPTGTRLDPSTTHSQKVLSFPEDHEARITEYFEVLLNNKNVTDETILTLEINGILLGNGCYSVLLAELDESVISAGRGADRFLSYTCLRNYLQQALSGTVVNYCRFIGGTLICLICFPRISDTTQLQESPMGHVLSQKASEVMCRFRQDYGLSANIFFSNYVQGIRNIHKAYAVAKDMQQYASFWGLQQTMLSALEEPALGQLMMDYPFFQQITDKLTNCFQLCKHHEIQDLLDEVVEYLRHAHPCRFQILITRILSFLNILFDKLLCHNIIDMKFLDATPFVAEMLQVSDEQGFRSRLNHYAELVERLVSRKKEASSLSLIQDIKTFIDTNFADSTLSVASLAEQFGMTQPTLTRRFQLVFGLSPSDCIHHVRVNQVKILLETTSLTLSQIGERTGYVSLSTMYRDFTKYEKTSPGRYRLLHKAANSP